MRKSSAITSGSMPLYKTYNLRTFGHASYLEAEVFGDSFDDLADLDLIISY